MADAVGSGAASGDAVDLAVVEGVVANGDDSDGGGLVEAAQDGPTKSGDARHAAEEEARLAESERASDPSELGFVPGEVVVVYEGDASASEREAALEDIEGVQLADEATFEVGDAIAVGISEDLTVETAAEIVAEDPAVKYAIPNYYVSILDQSVAAPQGATSFKMDDYQTAQ